jgi:hypothetical protein
MWQLTTVSPGCRYALGLSIAAAAAAGGQRTEAGVVLQNSGFEQREAGGSLSGSSGAPCRGTGPESAPVARTEKAWGIGDFSPTHGPDHRERWRPTNGTQRHAGPRRQWRREREPAERVRDAGWVWFNGSGPLELRNGFLILDKGFPLLRNRK